MRTQEPLYGWKERPSVSSRGGGGGGGGTEWPSVELWDNTEIIHIAFLQFQQIYSRHTAALYKDSAPNKRTKTQSQ